MVACFFFSDSHLGVIPYLFVVAPIAMLVWCAVYLETENRMARAGIIVVIGFLILTFLGIVD
jgi:hypothetical protein